MGKENQFHVSLVQYLKEEYPGVRFHSQLDGMHFTNRWAGVQAKRLQYGAGFPDLIILKRCLIYTGLALELKVTTPFKLNGEIKASKNDGLKRQESWLKYLREQGWMAEFAVGLDNAKALVDMYLSLDKKST